MRCRPWGSTNSGPRFRSVRLKREPNHDRATALLIHGRAAVTALPPRLNFTCTGYLIGGGRSPTVAHTDLYSLMGRLATSTSRFDFDGNLCQNLRNK